MLLGWLISAKRPLTWNEIQTLKSIDMDKELIEPKRRFADHIDPKMLCESFVNVRSDGTVDFVHTTAKV
jgi:hypothetical protein